MSIIKSIPFQSATKNDQNFILSFLGLLSIFFVGLFIASNGSTAVVFATSFFEVSFDKFSLFVGGIFSVSLFVGLFPIRNENYVNSSFFYYLIGGLGIILSNNLLTFFIFWSFQRALPCFRFIRSMKNDSTSAGGTFLLQHLLTFVCFLALLVLATVGGHASMSFSKIHGDFFTWPVLILTFIIIYESHGVFPFHSWIHDMVGNLSWYQISSLFLSRAGVLLFVKFLLPTINQDPDVFRILLLSLSIASSIYWTIKGIFETNVSKVTTYFYVAQSSLILTGLQADMVAARGAYMHMMVISLSGTALWSLVSYVQRSSSIKRLNQFYGLAQSYPKVATLFCLFGFNMIGTPLGAVFVSEDLVINGLLENQPFLGLGHILATCLNGILFFMVFSKLFLGQTSYPQKIKNLDMTYKQMIPYSILLIMMFSFGIVPSLFLENIKW